MILLIRIGIGIRQSWLQKYKKTFATYLQIGKNQIIRVLRRAR